MRVAIKATDVGGDGIGYYVRTLVAGLAAAEKARARAGIELLVLTDSAEVMESPTGVSGGARRDGETAGTARRESPTGVSGVPWGDAAKSPTEVASRADVTARLRAEGESGTGPAEARPLRSDCARPPSDAAGVEYLFVEHASPAWEQFRLPDLLEEHRVDLYHSPAFSLPLVKTCRYLPTVHDCIPVLFPHLVGPDFTAYFRRWAPQWFRSADHLLCNSAHTAHDLTHLYGVAPEDLSVVEHTGNPGFTAVTEQRAIAETHRRLGIDAPFVLMVGRVELRKNVAGMLAAFALLRQRALGPLLLVLAGARVDNAHDPAGLLPRVGRHGDVPVTGKVSEQDLRVLYSSAAAYCFPTFYEGFGRPLLEAMQCGTPVVTTRVSSLPEVGGDACLYVSPYEAGELADALQRVLTEAPLRAELVRRGFVRAGQFTAERMAAETLAVYERVGSGEACRHRRGRQEVVRRGRRFPG